MHHEFSTSFSSTSNYHGVNNPYIKQNISRPGSIGGHHIDNFQQQHFERFRLEIRVFPPPGKAGSRNNSTMNHASDPNTTLNNIKKVMQTITSTYLPIYIHSINGDTFFDHTMASYPDGRSAIDFFNIDSSELNARGFGHASAFVKASSHETLKPAPTDAAELRVHSALPGHPSALTYSNPLRQLVSASCCSATLRTHTAPPPRLCSTKRSRNTGRSSRQHQSRHPRLNSQSASLSTHHPASNTSNYSI